MTATTTPPAAGSPADGAPPTGRRPRPAPLGPAFTRLWVASMAANLSDGVGRLAVPLLAISLTTDPFAVSVISALAFVPWLIFSIPAGVIVDRVDRRAAMAIGNGIRLLAAIAVTLAIAEHALSLPLLYAVVLVFGMGETVVDNATNAVIPSVAPASGLDRANSRIQAAQVTVDHFVATPISGVLYAVAIWLPLSVAGAGYVVAAALALALPAVAARASRPGRAAGAHPDAAAPHDAVASLGLDAGPDTRAPVRAREGIAYLLHHRFLRVMVVVTSLIAGLFALAQGTVILLMIERFGVSQASIGVLTAGVGLGALAGALIAPAIVARVGRGRAMLIGSVLGGVGLAGVGFSGNLWMALACYAAGAFGVSSWNVPWGSLRQAIIPGHMLGRVTGVMRTVSWGLMPAATIVGGLIARVDLQRPFLVGGVGSLVVVLLAARLLLSADSHVPPPSD